VVARLRPRAPIIALTQHDYALRQMAIEWGVSAFLIPECDDVDTLLATSRGAALESGLVDEGDRVVITAGTAVNLPGTTDLIKVDAV
jgi:pyruvate kinase